MSLIADSGGLYALYDADDRHHRAVGECLEQEAGPIIVPLALLSEIDYLLRELLGIDAELDFLKSLECGAFTPEPTTAADLSRCRELVETYRGLDLGIADAAVIATAERLGVNRILTPNLRDFRAVTSRDGTPFILLPADRV